jgi:hypothetical protein
MFKDNEMLAEEKSLSVMVMESVDEALTKTRTPPTIQNKIDILKDMHLQLNATADSQMRPVLRTIAICILELEDLL